MKKRILLAISVLLVLGLAIVAFAYTKTNHPREKAAMACCCKDGVCPMKDKNAGAATIADRQNASCCDSPDCCCKGGSGDSCPMKKQGEKTSQTTNDEMKNVTVVSDDENCCQTGADCCKNGGGACCKKHKKS
jgi:hypothetical protein